MTIRLATSADDLRMYDQWIKNHPQGNLWQSLEWKAYQEALGREVRIYAAEDTSHKTQAANNHHFSATALVVIDRTTGGFSTWDIPRGPLGHAEHLMSTIMEDAAKDRCISIYFSPVQSFQDAHAHRSSRHEQPDATRLIDLSASQEDILKQMHQKGRYNIKVAEKNGVMVRESKDVDAYVALAKKTATRDGFTGASAKAYKTFLETIPGSFLLLAYAESDQRSAISDQQSIARADGSPLSALRTPIAGLIGVIWGKTGIYYYGASDYEHRALMAPYLLQWEAMKRCKEEGCTEYDLLGIAPPDSGPEHHWAGISDFKAKFGGSVINYPPEQEIVLRPMAKRALQLKRRILG